MRVRFAQYMASRGYLSTEQALGMVVETGSFHELIGAIAMSHRLLDMAQLDHILSQLSGEKRFGEVAIELGYLAPEHLESLLHIQDIQEAMEFGESLIVHGMVNRSQLLEEMSKFFAQVDAAPDSAPLAAPDRFDPAAN